jgi:hypothetical protein
MARLLVSALMLLAASTANAASLTYTLAMASSSDGYFVVDSSLAAPVGPSGVPLDDFLINLNTSVGVLSFGPGDITGGFIEARFLDGVLAGLHSTSNTTAEVTSPGHYGIAIFFSIHAGTAADIDPALAGEGNFTIVSLPAVTPVDDVCCSYGFAPAPIPEPRSVLLLMVGALVVLLARESEVGTERGRDRAEQDIDLK